VYCSQLKVRTQLFNDSFHATAIEQLAQRAIEQLAQWAIVGLLQHFNQRKAALGFIDGIRD
jgi:hypothetical protein